MLLGKVIGTVVSTQVYEGLQGVPMLLVQPPNKVADCRAKEFFHRNSLAANHMHLDIAGGAIAGARIGGEAVRIAWGTLDL